MKLRPALPTGFALLILATALLSAPVQADVGPEPPSISITSPVSGESFDGAPASIDVTLEVYEGDEGISEIYLVIDDQEVATDKDAPWGFEDITVLEGTHDLSAVAVSASNLDEYPSDPVSIVVFAGAADGDAQAGCSCQSVDNSRLGGAGGLIVLGLLSIAMGRRRRSPASIHAPVSVQAPAPAQS